MTLEKGDFVEVKFTAKVKDGDIFDSNIKEDLEKINPNPSSEQLKPFVFALGKSMFLKGVDDFLIGKPSTPVTYEIELLPENAFGYREQKLVRIIPMKIFEEHKVHPIPGEFLNLDNRIAKILSVSGGRVMLDFNNPLAGKTVIYNINVLRKVENLNEKINAVNDFLFRKDFKFEAENGKLILYVESVITNFIKGFKDKFKDLLNLELEVEEIKNLEEKKEEKKE